MKALISLFLGVLILLGGCATTRDRVLDTSDQTQLQKRSYQSRVFDTADKEKVMRATITTLQDLGFIIDRADLMLGTVSATKAGGGNVKITVSVRPKGADRMTVRANAQYGTRSIDDPKHYQDFFASLEKSLFLSAHAGE